MLEQLLKDIAELKVKSSSSIIRDLVSAAEKEGASEDQKKQITNLAKESNYGFLIPSEWIQKAEVPQSLKLIYAPLSEIEDVVELAIASDLVTVGNELESKTFDFTTLKESSYSEVGGSLEFPITDNLVMLDFIAYIVDQLSRSNTLTVSNGITTIVLEPDEKPQFVTIEKLNEYLPVQKAIDNSYENLLLPFGDNLVNNKNRIIVIQEKLSPFGAFVSFLQDGTIIVNVQPEFEQLINPVLATMGLTVRSSATLRDGSKLLSLSNEELIIETSFDFDKLATDLNLS